MPALLDAQRKTRGERPTWRRIDKQKNRITVISRATISSGRLPGLHCPGLLFLPPSEPLAPPIPVSPGSPASPVFCLALSLHPRFANPRHFERACRKSSSILYATSRPFSYSFYPLPSLLSSSTIVLFAPSIPFNAVSSRSQYGSVSRDFDSQTLNSLSEHDASMSLVLALSFSFLPFSRPTANLSSRRKLVLLSRIGEGKKTVDQVEYPQEDPRDPTTRRTFPIRAHFHARGRNARGLKWDPRPPRTDNRDSEGSFETFSLNVESEELEKEGAETRNPPSTGSVVSTRTQKNGSFKREATWRRDASKY